MMAGYSGTPLIKKLGVKEGFRIGLVNAPTNFVKDLGELPAKALIVTRLQRPLDVILFFTRAEKELINKFSDLAGKLAVNGMIWVAWPKKASGTLTDLSFDSVQRVGLQSGLVDVKICAIDETWSGLKFVYRLQDRKTISNKRR